MIRYDWETQVKAATSHDFPILDTSLTFFIYAKDACFMNKGRWQDPGEEVEAVYLGAWEHPMLGFMGPPKSEGRARFKAHALRGAPARSRPNDENRRQTFSTSAKKPQTLFIRARDKHLSRAFVDLKHFICFEAVSHTRVGVAATHDLFHCAVSLAQSLYKHCTTRWTYMYDRERVIERWSGCNSRYCMSDLHITFKGMMEYNQLG